MPRFRVTLCRTAYEYADLDVEADDLDAAEVQAVALADAHKVEGWETIHDASKVVNAEDLP